MDERFGCAVLFCAEFDYRSGGRVEDNVCGSLAVGEHARIKSEYHTELCYVES